MGRGTDPRRLMVLLSALIALAALPGCGGSDSDGTGSAQQNSSAQQRADDANAKAIAITAQTAIETYATETGGAYAGATAAGLKKIEPRLPAGIDVVANSDSYSITVRSKSGAKFTLSRDPGGADKRTCKPPGSGGCSSSGSW